MTIERFDKIIGVIMLLCAVLIAAVLWRGDHTFPTVRDFSFSKGFLNVHDHQLSFEFNRAMDEKSVEAHFSITPAAPGKFSWIGRRMAYTLSGDLAHDQTYSVLISDAQDSHTTHFSKPFMATFKTPPARLFYIGLTGNENGRLMAFDLKTKTRSVLSPAGMEVLDFIIHPDMEKAYIIGKPAEARYESFYELSLTNGSVKLFSDGERYKVFFDTLSPDGRTLLVARSPRSQADPNTVVELSTLWTVDTEKDEWKKFYKDDIYAVPLYFSPDSQFLLAYSISGEIMIIPMVKNNDPPAQLGFYTGMYGFSVDGSKILFTDQKNAMTPSSLVLRTNDGTTKTLIDNKGLINFPALTPDGEKVVYIMTEFLLEGYLSSAPHLYEYDLKKQASAPLSPDDESYLYFEGFFDISDDGRTIAVERYPFRDARENRIDYTDPDNKKTRSQLWLVDPDNGKWQDLGISGEKPDLN